MEKKYSASSGIGLFELLGVVFIVLKLCGVIDWSWWWVTAPIWIPIVLVFVIIAILFVVRVLRNLGKDKKWKKSS